MPTRREIFTRVLPAAAALTVPALAEGAALPERGINLPVPTNNVTDSGLSYPYTITGELGNQAVTFFDLGRLQDGSDGGFAINRLPVNAFGNVAGVMTGEAKIQVNRLTGEETATQPIYVLDIGGGPDRTSVILFVFNKTDTVTADKVTTSITLTDPFILPALVGGDSANVFMQSNGPIMLLATDQGPNTVAVNKSTLSFTTLPGSSSPPQNVSAMMVEDRSGSFVIVQGSGFAQSYTTYTPDAKLTFDGGGALALANSKNGAVPKNLFHSSTAGADLENRGLHRPQTGEFVSWAVPTKTAAPI